MRPWTDRTIEEANLFNPAFCALLIARCCKDFQKTQHRMPFALAFLVLPIVLHPGTRRALPYSTITSLHSWVQGNGATIGALPQHARALTPYAREAIIYGIRNAILALDDSGNLIVGKAYIASLDLDSDAITPDVRESLERASFLGRWFAAAGSPFVVFSTIGVTP